MFKKMLPWLIMVLISITLIIGAAFTLWFFLDNKDADQLDPHAKAQQSVNDVKAKKMSAKEISELTVEIKELLTNLASKDFLKISFAFELENEKAKEEFKLLEFKVRDIIIQTLSDLTSEQIQGSQGKDHLNTLLMNRINLILTEGKLTHINITDFILS
jgi:flagellar FliL protein